MPGHDIVVVGASAGGVEALIGLTSGLPADLPATILVVLHVPADATSVLPAILSRRGSLRAVHPSDGDPIECGRMYIAPPDMHLLVKRGAVRVTRGPSENGHRPAIDPLFRTAARAYGPRVVGVVLSGTLDDGTAGLAAVKQEGGITIVQDPADALYSGMPRSAMEHVAVDHIAPLAEIPGLIQRLAAAPLAAQEPAGTPPETEEELDMAELEEAALHAEVRPGSPSGFSCPDCHGVLWQVEDEPLLRFRCRVGHAYSAESLLSAQSGALDAALWTAVRALEETMDLRHRIAGRLRRRGHLAVADRFQHQAHEARHSALVLRQVLASGELSSTPDIDDTEQDAG